MKSIAYSVGRLDIAEGAAAAREYDLEGIFWDSENHLLGIVSEFDLDSGINTRAEQVVMGDIFIDVDGGVVTPTPGEPQNGGGLGYTFGYAYVIDVDWANHRFDVYALMG